MLKILFHVHQNKLLLVRNNRHANKLIRKLQYALDVITKIKEDIAIKLIKLSIIVVQMISNLLVIQEKHASNTVLTIYNVNQINQKFVKINNLGVIAVQKQNCLIVHLEKYKYVRIIKNVYKSIKLMLNVKRNHDVKEKFLETIVVMSIKINIFPALIIPCIIVQKIHFVNKKIAIQLLVDHKIHFLKELYRVIFVELKVSQQK